MKGVIYLITILLVMAGAMATVSYIDNTNAPVINKTLAEIIVMFMMVTICYAVAKVLFRSR
jgi:hypothetical protein